MWLLCHLMMLYVESYKLHRYPSKQRSNLRKKPADAGFLFGVYMPSENARLVAAETAESTAAHIYPGWPVLEQDRQAQLTPLYEQQEAIVRDLLGGLENFPLDRYIAECRSRSTLGDKTCKYQKRDSIRHSY